MQSPALWQTGSERARTVIERANQVVRAEENIKRAQEQKNVQIAEVADAERRLSQLQAEPTEPEATLCSSPRRRRFAEAEFDSGAPCHRGFRMVVRQELRVAQRLGVEPRSVATI